MADADNKKALEDLTAELAKLKTKVTQLEKGKLEAEEYAKELELEIKQAKADGAGPSDRLSELREVAKLFGAEIAKALKPTETVERRKSDGPVPLPEKYVGTKYYIAPKPGYHKGVKLAAGRIVKLIDRHPSVTFIPCDKDGTPLEATRDTSSSDVVERGEAPAVKAKSAPAGRPSNTEA